MILNIDSEELKHVLSGLYWLTLAAYDGKDVSREEITKTYERILTSIEREDKLHGTGTNNR